MNNIIPTLKYLWLTTKHKYFVFLAGLKLKVPIWQLVIHDWVKYLPCEAPHYGRQFFGDKSDPLGFTLAWLHHQRQKHHWEAWIPVTGHNRGGHKDLEPLPMPEKYIREMVADWLGASRAYEGKYPENLADWKWFWDNFETKIKPRLHKDTADLTKRIILSYF
jgi:hypothetical protein